MNKLEETVLNKFGKFVQENSISNEFLVQIIELAGQYLNLQTINSYAKKNKMSYNGVKNFRRIVKIFDCKFVIDNE